MRRSNYVLTLTLVWSNFEIADLEFWRGPAYTAFFDYLDKRGGFYYERWGDAPVHSIAAALFAKREQIQFFDEIGEWWFDDFTLTFSFPLLCVTHAPSRLEIFPFA